MKKRRV